jgi:hypothetical protein
MWTGLFFMWTGLFCHVKRSLLSCEEVSFSCEQVSFVAFASASGRPVRVGSFYPVVFSFLLWYAPFTVSLLPVYVILGLDFFHSIVSLFYLYMRPLYIRSLLRVCHIIIHICHIIIHNIWDLFISGLFYVYVTSSYTYVTSSYTYVTSSYTIYETSLYQVSFTCMSDLFCVYIIFRVDFFHSVVGLFYWYIIIPW